MALGTLSVCFAYTPQFFDRLVLLDRRKQQIETIADELAQAYREGDAAVEPYLVQLDESLAGLIEAHKQLAAFIAREFPLSGAPG